MRVLNECRMVARVGGAAAPLPVAALLAITLNVFAAAGAGAQDSKAGPGAVLSGFVRDSSSVLGGASVSLEGAAAIVTTTSGRFRIETAAGSHALRVRALGYAPFDTVVSIGSDVTEITIMLRKSAVRLERVTVTASGVAKPFRYANTAKFDEFYERRATATGGTFLTREDIERANRNEAYELLQNVPGVQFSGRPGQPPLMRIARCAVSNSSPFAPIGKIDPVDKDGMEKNVTLQLFINGLRVGEPLTTLGQLKPDDIEAIEFYRGTAQLPLAARGDGCAAIFVWTRYSVGSVLSDSTR